MVIDLANGIFIFAMVSLIWGMEPSWASALNLFLAICFAFLPDIDFGIMVGWNSILLPFINWLLRILKINKQFVFRFISHQIIHYPLLLIPLCFVAGYWRKGFYGAFFFSAAVFAHFFHDSFNPTEKNQA